MAVREARERQDGVKERLCVGRQRPLARVLARHLRAGRRQTVHVGDSQVLELADAGGALVGGTQPVELVQVLLPHVLRVVHHRVEDSHHLLIRVAAPRRQYLTAGCLRAVANVLGPSHLTKLHLSPRQTRRATGQGHHQERKRPLTVPHGAQRGKHNTRGRGQGARLAADL